MLKSYVEWLNEPMNESVLKCPKCGIEYITDYGRGPQKAMCRKCHVEMEQIAKKAG